MPARRRELKPDSKGRYHPALGFRLSASANSLVRPEAGQVDSLTWSANSFQLHLDCVQINTQELSTIANTPHTPYSIPQKRYLLGHGMSVSCSHGPP